MTKRKAPTRPARSDGRPLAERMAISQPPEWWQAFREQARADGYRDFSEWVGDALLAQLPAAVRRRLPPRPSYGRPRKAD